MTEIQKRLTSLRGEVIREIWKNFGGNPEEIQILAVGTTSVPTHLEGYKTFLDNFIDNSHKALKKGRSSLDVGYDLLSTGSSNSRRLVLEMFNQHYGSHSNFSCHKYFICDFFCLEGFGPEVLGKMLDNSAICAGGMCGLKFFSDAFILNAKKKNTVHRFIQPDNSFGTWWSIIESANWEKDRTRREVYSVGTSSRHLLSFPLFPKFIYIVFTRFFNHFHSFFIAATNSI